MLHKENEYTEYKRELTEALKKEVLAFVNTEGGSIYIGVDDDGAVLGVEDCDQTMLRIASMLRDAIHPDIMMFVAIQTEQIEEKDIIHLSISGGSNKPYYLKKHGLKPSGVYVRQGSASVPASPEQIRQLIKNADGDSFEETLSLNQELTFHKTAQVFQEKGLKFERPQFLSLGLVRQDGLYTNLGLLLSDQCPFSIKAAVFQGTDQRLFKDRREFTGPLLAQLEDCYAYMQLSNQTSAEFHGLYRQDKKSYPEEALREALLNSLIHRDYAFSASSMVGIYADRMEFTSIGGLLPGIHRDDILLGISVCRNPGLANIFYRLELIEAYGTGLLKIQSAYRENPTPPEFIVATNAFKVILPVLDEQHFLIRENTALSPESQLLAFMQKKKSISRQEAEDFLKVSMSTTTRILNSLMEQGKLQRIGKGKNTSYQLAPASTARQ